MKILAALLLLLAMNVGYVAAAPAAFDRSHAGWNRLLEAHVRWNASGTATSVDYAGFGRDRQALGRYLADASSVQVAQFRQWPKPERDAFLVNVYNAATIELVLTRYPDLKSIKQLGGLFGSPWKLQVLTLLGRRRSLDEIEHTLLRGAADYDDPRIHFAVNCASVGCPALRPEAYLGRRLETQLDDQTRRFLRDRSRNRHDVRTDGLRVSPIFDWYAEDFGAHGGGVNTFLARYPVELGLDAGDVMRLRAGRMPVAFTAYDWRLNRRPP
jgi:hypothetical protein